MKKNHKLSLLVILLIALGLRLFKLPQLFYFSMDEALLAFRGWGLFVLKRPFLIGGPSPLQVHLPPYFYYLAAILLAPFKFNPLGWGVWSALISLITVFCLYCLGKKMVSSRVGLLAALLYAVSFTAIFFDRHFWPLNLNPLLTLLTLILLTKLSVQSIWPYLGLAGILVLALTADPSNIPLALAVVVFVFLFRKKISFKFSLISLIAASTVFFTPLLLFDLRHNWQNLAGLSRLAQTTVARQANLSSFISGLLLLPRSLVRFWHSPQTDLVKLYSYCIPYANSRLQGLSWFLVVLALAILLWFIKKNWRSPRPIFRIISILILFYFGGILLFSGLGYSIFDHYLAALLPIFALITAIILLTKVPKLIGYIIITVLVTANLWQVSRAHNHYGLSYKQNLVSWANQQLAGEKFALDVISKCHRENGLRYLFELTDNPPQISFMDPNFFWLYRQLSAKTMPDKVLLVTDKQLNLKLPVISQQTFGAMNAYILDNSNQTYRLQTP